MDFLDRIQSGQAAEFIDLIEDELPLYRGCGYYLAAVVNDRIVSLHKLGSSLSADDIINDNFERYFSGELEPWWIAQSGDIYVGMMSCHQFCNPRKAADLAAEKPRLATLIRMDFLESL